MKFSVRRNQLHVKVIKGLTKPSCKKLFSFEVVNEAVSGTVYYSGKREDSDEHIVNKSLNQTVMVFSKSLKKRFRSFNVETYTFLIEFTQNL